MKNVIPYLFLLISCGVITACGSGTNNEPSDQTPIAEPKKIEHLGGGTATVINNTSDAFSKSSANLESIDDSLLFNIGNDFFENPWIAGSSSTSSRDGLGGLFNNNACQNCHIRDGRGHAPLDDNQNFSSILFKAARTNITTAQQNDMLTAIRANVPDSSVGSQLQHNAVANVLAEVTLAVEYAYENITFADGHTVELRRPHWLITNNQVENGYHFDSDTLFSARIAPPMTGLGLLALIPEAVILANSDVNDTNNDGISGKANNVWSIEENRAMLGRFGWKAGQPSLIEQAAGAFVNDMGLTSRIQTVDTCMPHQVDCQQTDNGNGDFSSDYDYEVSDKILDAINFYSHHLAVPARRNAYDADVQRGKALFKQMNCDGCHVESYVTGDSEAFPELANQTIFPYSDLLLHDMGAELADFSLTGEPAAADTLYEFSATAHEWRTPPLWGIGRAKLVDARASFLHDGRARTIMEAILWHGGEAESAKQQVLQLNAQERGDLMAFLNDL